MTNNYVQLKCLSDLPENGVNRPKFQGFYCLWWCSGDILMWDLGIFDV